MSLSWAWFRTRIFGIALVEATFARRNFRPADTRVQERLERAGQTFLSGYRSALENTEPATLEMRLEMIEREWRGFAYEGAAMALGLLDRLTPWNRRRWSSFVASCGAPHLYMAHIALGWVAARLPVRMGLWWAQLDPLLRWLVLDGYGFHEGYFRWPSTVVRRAVPRKLHGYARRAFDQGLGRSLWFVEGADSSRIAATIATFAVSRQADLWSGVGLACAYAGGSCEAAINALRRFAGSYQLQLAQGVAFAAKARQRAGNPAAHTELACNVLCGLTAEEAAELTDAALEDLPPDGAEPAYEMWRRRIQAALAGHRSGEPCAG